MSQLTQNSTNSSDYFDDDPEFLKAITEVPLPHASPQLQVEDELEAPPLAQPRQVDDEEPPPLNQRSLKRARSPEDLDFQDEGTHYHGVLASVADGGEDSYLESHTYGAARFGELGEYMTRKRAKLQLQNAEMDVDEDEADRSKIFRDLQIYVRPLRSIPHARL